nr:hypothetical protein [Tanacetum cinerariifolium]
VEEHSGGGSRISNDMHGFIDCDNNTEMKDLCSNGVFYTWIKSPLNPQNNSGWKTDVHRCQMFKLVKKLKGIKGNLKALRWKNRNLHELVENYRQKLKQAQVKLDNNPHDQEAKKQEIMALVDYNEAIKDEESFMFQKAKVKWISKGDKNNLYLHKVEMEDFEGMFGARLNEEEALKWEMVEADVCFAIKEFFNTGKLLGELNATLISLIPKIKRIKLGLHNLVDLNQIAFIQGRVIQDNILISQELLKGYDRKNEPSRCCFKINIAKAYDTMDWKFLERCLINFGFHGKMVKWIMVCVTSAKFSININGERKGYFSSGRGLRQGDPVSPCLFTLVMEIFTLLMLKNVQGNPKFKFHKCCKEMRLTNMCFADDLMVVYHGDVDSTRTVKVTMVEFSAISGLIPNMGKSTIFFRSVKDVDKEKILDILHFVVGKLPMKYLGVPLITKKSLELRNAKVKWETVCSPKSHGGLGLRIFGKWNEILLMKNLWNITEDRNTMWVNVVKLRGKSLWEVQKEANDSWMWKCLLELRCKIRQNIFKVLGDGKGTNFWFDQWNSKGTLSEIISRKDVYAAMLVGNESVWDMIEDNKWRCPNGWILKYPIQGRFMDFGGPLPSPQRGP